MIYELNYKLTDKDIQSSYQHVHHADAIRLLEKARLNFIAEKGFSSESFFKKNLFLVISSLDITYKRELKLGEIKITCDKVLFDNKKIIIQQKIFNHQNKLAIEANVTSMIMSGETKRAVKPEQDFIDAIS